MKNTVTLTNNKNGLSYDFEILSPSIGPSAIDFQKLYAKTGMFSYDPGFTSTASCKSTITYIDGEKGKLLYRGYKIDDLAKKKSYLDVCFLFLEGILPTDKQRQELDIELRRRSFVHEGIKNLFDDFPDKAHPMAMISSAISALSTFYFEHLDICDEVEYKTMAKRIVAKIPTLAAFSHRRSFGLPLIYPDLNRTYTENFLYMIRAYPNQNLFIPEVEIKALDTIFTLHADHEQNASTSIVRGVASTGAHPYAAISAGVNALWGRAHGGANEAVMAQLELIGSIDNIDKFIKRAKDPNDEFRLMGFGHRVYKNFDPRAVILKNLLNELKDELGIDNNLLNIAQMLIFIQV